jgi:hypothetical protein
MCRGACKEGPVGGDKVKPIKIFATVVLLAAIASALTTPVIKASGSLLNQATPFNQTLYTPTVNGLWRVTMYAENTTGNWGATQVSASVSFTTAHGADTAGCVLQGSNFTGKCELVIRDLATNAIAASVTANTSATIDFYYVVERIQ